MVWGTQCTKNNPEWSEMMTDCHEFRGVPGDEKWIPQMCATDIQITDDVQESIRKFLSVN